MLIHMSLDHIEGDANRHKCVHGLATLVAIACDLGGFTDEEMMADINRISKASWGTMQ